MIRKKEPSEKAGIIYARYSSKNQDDSFSIAAQLSQCKRTAAQHEKVLLPNLVDKAKSALNGNRPAFIELLRMARKPDPLFDTIFVYKFDRFYRDRVEMAVLRRELKQNGVRIISATETVPENDSMSILAEAMYDAMAQVESVKIAERTAAGMVEAAKEGFHTGGMALFGFKLVKVQCGKRKRSRLVPLPKVHVKVKAVTWMFKRFVHGDIGYKNLAREMTVKWAKKCGRRDFFLGFVRDALRNDRYIGDLTIGKRHLGSTYQTLAGSLWEPVTVKGSHPPLISKKLFQKAQCIIKLRDKDKTGRMACRNNDFVLSGLMFCAACGSTLIGVSGTNGRGSKYRYYSCGTRRRSNKCSQRHIKADALEKQVFSEIKHRIVTPENIFNLWRASVDAHNHKVQTLGSDIASLDKQIKKRQKGLDRLYKLAESTDDLDMADFAPRLKQLRQEIRDLEAERVGLQAMKVETMKSPSKKAATSYAEGLIAIIETNMRNKTFLGQFIDRITVDGDAVTVDYKPFSAELGPVFAQPTRRGPCSTRVEHFEFAIA